MKRKIGMWVVASVLIVSYLYGCATFTRDAYRAGAISKAAHEVVMQGMGELYKEGLIGEDDKDAAVKYGRLHQDVHNKAIESLARYRELGLDKDRDDYLDFAAKASLLLAEMMNYARPYLLKHGKELP